jgi:hypothetical protein
MQEKFVITNTTVKAPRVDPRTKQDTRSLSERNGYSVSYRNAKDSVVVLRASEHRIVTEVPDSVYGLENEGLVSVRKLKDVADELQAHAFSTRRTAKKPEVPAFQDQEPPRPEGGKRLARTVEMGQDGHRGAESPEDGAVYPDGKPNFVVTAPSAETRRRGKKRA